MARNLVAAIVRGTRETRLKLMDVPCLGTVSPFRDPLAEHRGGVGANRGVYTLNRRCIFVYLHQSYILSGFNHP